MKKIMFIISSLQGLGGTERVVTTLANSLSKKYNVTIISRNINGGDNAYLLDTSVNDVKTNNGNLGFLFFIKKYVTHHHPDYVVVHTMSKLTPMFLLSGVKAKRIWSMEHISYEFHNMIYQKLRRLLYNRLDKILVFTEDQKKIYLEFNDNVSIVRNPCPLDIVDQTYNKNSKDIISIGRLTYQKGYDLLIESWALIEKKHPDWHLHIYGEGEDRESLNSLINKYSLKNVHLKGQVLDVCNVYDSASFYVMSSRYEGLPMVLIEAQSRGLPLVSFDCPTGPREIVKEDINGILIPPNDIIGLSKSIERLIESPESRSQMSTMSKRLSKQFLTTEVVNSWIDFFES